MAENPFIRPKTGYFVPKCLFLSLVPVTGDICFIGPMEAFTFAPNQGKRIKWQ